MENKLREACANGNIEEVKKLLNEQTVIENPKWKTIPFETACSEGYLEIAELLLNDQGLEVNKGNRSKATPFWIACSKGQVEIVKLLLSDQRVDINQAKSNYQTPFYIACWKGHIEVVKVLLASERDININQQCNKKKTALEISKTRSNTIRRSRWETPEEFQIAKTNCSFIVTLIESYQKNPKETQFQLRKEVEYREDQILKSVTKNGIQIFKQYFEDDENWKSPEFEETLFVVCKNGRLEIVEYVLAYQRESNILSINYKGILLLEIAKINSESQEKMDHEKKEIEVKQRQKNCLSIHKLLEEYQSDPKKVKKQLRKKLNLNDIEDVEMDGILCREAIICGDIKKFKKYLHPKIGIEKEYYGNSILSLILNSKIDIEKKPYWNSILNLISEPLKFEFIQELSKSFPIDLNFNNIPLSQQTIEQLSQVIQKIYKLRSLRIQGCSISKENLLLILRSLIANIQVNDCLQKIRVDDIKFEKYEGLEMIPIEIRDKGTKSIAQYMIDLSKTSQSTYRTKLMVVGYENVGKTTLLDCLFPLSDKIIVSKTLITNALCLFRLEGKFLTRYHLGELEKQYILENKEWGVKKAMINNKFAIRIKKSNEKIELPFGDEEKRDLWFERISRLVANKATHGIEVNTHIWNSSTLNQYENKNLGVKRNRNEEKKDKDDHVEFSTWDFAGQNDYYNTHHYFLSNRSIFLVLYRLDQGIKGLESLDFWLKSLSSHLNQNNFDDNGKPFYSIIIIGTFLDLIDDLKVSNNSAKSNPRKRKSGEVDNDQSKDMNLRKAKAMQICSNNGFKSPPFYFEVSCSTLQNIEELREIIFNISLKHSYMGENVPIGYLLIEKSIYELRKLKQDHPIIEIRELIDHVQEQSSFEFDLEFTKRALRLLHEWGVCNYFDNPTELSNIVVLDPQHFTKNILGDLFKADESSRQMRLKGIIDYSQLNTIWNGPTRLIDTYLALLEKFEVCFILEDQNENENGNEKKLIIPNLLPDPDMIKETKNNNLSLLKELEEKENLTSSRTEKEKIINKREMIQKENQRIISMEYEMSSIRNKLEKKWPPTIPLNTIEIERIFSFNQVPSEMVSRLLVRFHDKIVDNIIWRRGVLLKLSKNDNILCLLEVKMEENVFEIRIRGKERNECLEMMKHIYEEVKIVSGNYKGVKWKECVRSPHFSKGLIDLDSIKEDCKLELKDRKLICPITHFPIYGEDLLFKTGLLDSLDNQDDIGNDYWKLIYRNQNQLNGLKPIYENSEAIDEELFEGLKKVLELLGFDLSKVEKVIGNDNINLKDIFKLQCKQTFQRVKDDPNRYKKEDWNEGNDIELRKSTIQYLGDYISKFRKFGWNYGNNAFVIPMIQGTSEDVAHRISLQGFSAVPKNVNDLGYFSLGVYTTSKEKYARKYCKGDTKVFVIGFMIVERTSGNGQTKRFKWKDIYKRKVNEKGYFGKPINPGYNSHITLVNGNSTATAYPITKLEQLSEEWTVDELVVHESQTYPCYIVYTK